MLGTFEDYSIKLTLTKEESALYFFDLRTLYSLFIIRGNNIAEFHIACLIFGWISS